MFQGSEQNHLCQVEFSDALEHFCWCNAFSHATFCPLWDLNTDRYITCTL